MDQFAPLPSHIVRVKNEILYVSKLTKVNSKKLRIFLSAFLANATVLFDILIICKTQYQRGKYLKGRIFIGSKAQIPDTVSLNPDPELCVPLGAGSQGWGAGEPDPEQDENPRRYPHAQTQEGVFVSFSLSLYVSHCLSHSQSISPRTRQYPPAVSRR